MFVFESTYDIILFYYLFCGGDDFLSYIPTCWIIYDKAQLKIYRSEFTVDSGDYSFVLYNQGHYDGQYIAIGDCVSVCIEHIGEHY